MTFVPKKTAAFICCVHVLLLCMIELTYNLWMLRHTMFIGNESNLFLIQCCLAAQRSWAIMTFGVVWCTQSLSGFLKSVNDIIISRWWWFNVFSIFSWTYFWNIPLFLDVDFHTLVNLCSFLLLKDSASLKCCFNPQSSWPVKLIFCEMLFLFISLILLLFVARLILFELCCCLFVSQKLYNFLV